jgi:transposase
MNTVIGEEKMGKKGTDRRVYTQEFKSEAVGLVEKREKPVSHVAKDLGLNESMLRRWVSEARGTTGTGVTVFPGHGRPRDAELTRLRKEVKSLREANEILKKAAVIFAQSEPQ